MSFVHQEWGHLVHLLPLRSSDSQCWKWACLIFLWRPYHTNEHAGVIHWERFAVGNCLLLMVKMSKHCQFRMIYYNFMRYQQNGSYCQFLLFVQIFSSTLLTIFLTLIMVLFPNTVSFKNRLGTAWQTGRSSMYLV